MKNFSALIVAALFGIALVTVPVMASAEGHDGHKKEEHKEGHDGHEGHEGHE